MPRRRRLGKGAAGGMAPKAHPVPVRTVPGPSGQPSSSEVASAGSGSGSTGEMAAAASSGAAPVVRPENGAEGTGRIMENQSLKAATASSGGVPTLHPGKGLVGTVSNGEMLEKKAPTVTNGGAPIVHPGKLAEGSGPGSGSNGDMLQKKAAMVSSRGAPMTHPSKGATGSGSIGVMLQEKAAEALEKEVNGSDSSGTMLQKKVAATSSGQIPTMGFSEVMPQKNTMALSRDPALGALNRNITAPECASKHSTKEALTLPGAKIPQKHHTEDKAADMGLSGGMLQKQSSKVEVDTGLSEEMLHEHPAQESDTAKGIQDSNSNQIAHIKDIQEAKLLIQKLNALGKGEDISSEEFLAYYKQLASDPAWINLGVRLEDKELDKQENRHALLRLRYYKHKFSQQASEEDELLAKLKEDHHLRLLHESEDDCTEEFLEEEDEELYYDKLKEARHLSLLHKSEDDCNDEFLEEEDFFRRFEEAKAFDWFFHRGYLGCSSLDDYQCLVLKNYGGTEYTRWSEYHEYLHSYEIEKEYLKYCEELSKQLKWMEDYVDTDRPSVKWSKISSRGAYQAIKIAATSFHKITPALAYNGYFECKENMVYDYTFYKEVEGVYFEIWRRVTHGTKSFKDALEEVYNLNRFLSRQRLMKAALESDDTMKKIEEEFRTCTEAIKPEVEDKAQELIAEAVRKLVDEPKSYAQYIRKKIQIARIIRIIDSDDEE